MIGSDCENIIHHYNYQLIYNNVVDEIKQRFRHKYLNTQIRFLNEHHSSMFDTEHKYDHYYHEDGKQVIPYMKDPYLLFPVKSKKSYKNYWDTNWQGYLDGIPPDHTLSDNYERMVGYRCIF